LPARTSASAGRRSRSEKPNRWEYGAFLGQQECGKILWAALGGGGEGAVEAPREHVAWPHIVVRGHDEMGQQRLRRRLGTAETAELVHDAVGAERCQEVELRRARGGGAAVRQVDNLTCTGPSMALWGASTKLVSPSECQ
jgi:hypothetical protein